jgi:iron complex outermembrane recepter protein
MIIHAAFFQTGRFLRFQSLVGVACLGIFLHAAELHAQESWPSPAELKGLPFEQLLSLEVVSVTRKKQQIGKAASAIEVITQEDIRRSGARTIPDALRLATGMHVARANERSWAISARGFNITTANKMQVVMDGRSLYSPLFSGVFWDAQDYLLEDIERIEVIRGPGATMWGANAVNGVINIITKHSRETQGVLITGGGGTVERGFGGVRYGGQAGENTFYRAHATYFNRDEMVFPDGRGAGSPWQMGSGGFRLDSELTAANFLTVQAEGYYGLFGEPIRDDTEVAGGHLLGRWTHQFSPESELQLQTYYDRSDRRIPGLWEEERNTYDLDLQHRFAWRERHEMMWGFNYRMSMDDIVNSPTVGFIPDQRTLHMINGFIQDEIELAPDFLGVTLGSKLEHNEFSGFEYQPSIRMALTPTPRQIIWAAVSRAVRTPTRIDQDILLRTPEGRVTVRGDRDFRSEKVMAYETGYRVQPHETVSLDLATFYHVYDHLRSQEPEGPGGPLVLRNLLEGETYGAELAAIFSPVKWWRLRAAYTHLQKRLRLDPASMDPTGGRSEGNDPGHIFVLHSSFNLPASVELDGILRYVDRLPDPHVPSYLVMDLRLGWFPRPSLEFSLVGRNLMERQHREFGAGGVMAPEVRHSAYGKVTWRF